MKKLFSDCMVFGAGAVLGLMMNIEEVWGAYWSSETDSCNPDLASIVFSGASNVGMDPKPSKNWVFAVRSTQH
jgi:hypothetical protein